MSSEIVIRAAQIFIGVLSIGVLLTEFVLHAMGRRNVYRFADSVANLCTAIIYAALGGLAIACILPVYEAIRANFALFDIEPTNAFAWILGFVCADFCHYWFHRAAHRNNLMWGIHQGHHSSEDFNLGIALRKGIFQQWVDWPFFLPMALLGFPFFTMYLPLKGAQFAYQFWIHNQFIGKLGVVEKVLVTPSAHRVHHGQNAPYIDKNYAGVFILWDRLFGSYAEEKEPVVYGIGTPVRTFNPLGMQFKYWNQLWRDARASTNKWDLLRTWFMPTGWRPANRQNAEWPGKIKDCTSYEKYDRPVDARTKIYVLIQFAAMALLTAGLGGDPQFNVSIRSVGSLVLVIWAAWSIGLLLDHALRPQIELARQLLLVACAAAVMILQPDSNTVAPSILLILSPISIAMLAFMKTSEQVEAKDAEQSLDVRALKNNLLDHVPIEGRAET
jgi:alkylglycerol monooxygenase